MDYSKANDLAIQLINEHGLADKGWYFQFDNAKRRYGCCNYTLRQISLSKYLLPHMKEEDVRDTILHEIAHALVGSGHGHNYQWRAKALEIGCNGQRCGSKVEDRSKLTYKYVGTCPNGHQIKRHKLTKNARLGSCPHCSNRYDPQYKFNWVQNY